MANEKQEIVLEIQVNQSQDNLAKLRASMDLLIQKRQELTKEAITGDTEQARSIEETNSKLRNMQTEYKAQQRVLDGYNASVKTNVNTSNLAANSIQQNRDLLKQLTAQYIQLKTPSENATSQIKHLSDVLKEQESAIGNNTRKVGSYKEALSEAFKELNGIGKVIDPIKNMGLAFESAGGGVKGFGAALATTGLPLIIAGINLLITAFSDFKPLAEAVENIMGGLSSVFSSSYSEGVKLVKLKRELEDADREQIVTNAELRKSINELEAIAAGKGRKDQERIDALEGANKLRIQQLKIETDLAEKAKKIADKEVDDAVQSAIRKAGLLTAIGFGTEGVVSDAVLKKQAEAQAKLIDLQDKFNQATISNNDMIMRLKQSIEDDAKAKDAESLKRIKDTNDKKDKLHKEEVAQWKTAQSELDELVSQSTADETAMYDAQIKRIKEQNYAIDLLKDNAAMQLDLQRKTHETQQQIDDEFAASNYKTFKDYYDAKLVLYKTDSENYKKEEEAKYTIASAVQSAFSSLANIAGQQTAEGIAFSKIAAIAQIAIDTAKAISSGIAGATTAATATGPGAFIATPVFIATTIATILAAVASATAVLSTANTPTAPKFAEGGKVIDIGGNYHSDGGTPIHVGGQYVAEAEKDEGLFIMKRTAYQAGKLSNWNQLFGGKSWGVSTGKYAAQGGMVIPTDGGFAARDIARNSDNSALIQNAIKNGFALAPAPVLSIVEFQTKQNDRNRSVNISEA